MLHLVNSFWDLIPVVDGYMLPVMYAELVDWLYVTNYAQCVLLLVICYPVYTQCMMVGCVLLCAHTVLDDMLYLTQ